MFDLFCYFYRPMIEPTVLTEKGRGVMPSTTERVFLSEDVFNLLYDIVSSNYSVTMEDLTSTYPTRHVTWARGILVALWYSRSNVTLLEIGSKLHLHYSTLCATVKRVSYLLQTDANCRFEYDIIKNKLVSAIGRDPRRVLVGAGKHYEFI